MGRSQTWSFAALLFVAIAALPFIFDALGLEGRELRAQLGFVSLLLAWGIYALSYNVIYGLTGLLSFAHSAFLGTGALAVGIATTEWGAGLWGSLVIAIVGSTLAALILGAIAVRVRGMAFVVATAALALIASLLVLYFSDWTGGNSGIRLPREALNLGIGDLKLVQREIALWFNLLILALVLIALRWLMRSPLGLAFKLVRENEPKAALIGYNTTRLKWISFTISGSLAGLGGGLLALTQGSMNGNLFSWTHSIDALAWVAIGGAGTLWGPLLGVGALHGVEHAIGDFVPISPSALAGVLLILFALLAPKGIAGLISKLKGGAGGRPQN